jgi:PAS domain S-box-containing protein
MKGWWEVDFVKDTVWRSEGCERLLGVQPEKSEPSFIWWADRLHPDDRQRTVDSFNAAQEGDADHWSAEYRMRRFNGSYGVFLDRAYIARDKTGKATRVVGAIHDITEWRHAEEERLSYQWQLRTLASELNSAEDRERKRLAVDLHDDIGQVLSVVQMKMKMLGTGCLAVEQAALVDQVNELLECMDEDLGQLVFELFPPMLHELGLRESLEWLADQFKDQHGLQVQVEDDRQPKPLSEDRHSMVFRATRELLFNVVKHAQSKNATVSLRKKGEVVCLEVADNGQGFDPSMI